MGKRGCEVPLFVFNHLYTPLPMIRPLTSLRLLFALMVFASHCNIISDQFDIPLLTEGYVGVSFFFVLSGFIIAYSYDERFASGSVTKREFWTARVARIYPLHLLMLMVAATLGTYSLSNGLGQWLTHFIPNSVLCQAYVPSADYYFSFNSPSWSLCCEQLFYLAFPLLASLLRRPRHLTIAFILSAIAVVVGMHFTPEPWAKDVWYVNPIARFPDFLLGMWIYQLASREQNTSLTRSQATWQECGAVTLFVLFYTLSVHVPQVYRYSCYYWLPIALVIYIFSLQRGWLSQFLSCRLLVWGGEVSFGFYLIHHMLFRLYVEAQHHLQFSLSPYIAILALLLLTLLLSGVSYRYFEQPANKFVKRLAFLSDIK